MRRACESEHEWGWRSRVDRAFTQRIYLMEAQAPSPNEFRFQVMGNSGKPYNIVVDDAENAVGNGLWCSCPDHSLHNNLCKHLLFVLIRMLDHSKPDVFESYYEQSSFDVTQSTVDRCRDYFERRERMLQNTADDEVQGCEKRKPVDDEDECPICYETFGETRNETQVWCRAQCGKSLHNECFLRWVQQAGDNVTCVYCRAKWEWEGAPRRI